MKLSDMLNSYLKESDLDKIKGKTKNFRIIKAMTFEDESELLNNKRLSKWMDSEMNKKVFSDLVLFNGDSRIKSLAIFKQSYNKFVVFYSENGKLEVLNCWIKYKIDGRKIYFPGIGYKIVLRGTASDYSIEEI